MVPGKGDRSRKAPPRAGNGGPGGSGEPRSKTGRKLTPNQVLYEEAVELASKAIGRPYERIDERAELICVARRVRDLGLDEVRRRIRLAFAGDRREYPIIELLEQSHWGIKTLMSAQVMRSLGQSTREIERALYEARRKRMETYGG